MNLKKKPVISVIVPVYNSEKYLPDCLESILGQTFGDFELLLIDDGSQDNSGSICDKYASRDSRVHVFHRDNGGVSSARNFGLENARGEWIAFIDSDDFIVNDTFEKIISCVMDIDVSIVQYSITSDIECLGKSNKNSNPCSPYEYIHKGLFLVGMPGNFIKRTTIYENHIRFNESLKLAEDMIFVFSCIASSKKCQRLYDVLYYYRDNPDGSSNNKSSQDMALSCIAQHNLKIQFPLFSSAIDRSICCYLLLMIKNNDFIETDIHKLIKLCLPFDKSLLRGTQLVFASVAQINIYWAIKLVKWKYRVMR